MTGDQGETPGSAASQDIATVTLPTKYLAHLNQDETRVTSALGHPTYNA